MERPQQGTGWREDSLNLSLLKYKQQPLEKTVNCLEDPNSSVAPLNHT